MGLLCACIVRRLCDLWRICLYFIPFLSSLMSSFLSFCSCVCLSFYLFAPAFFVCPLVLCLSSLFVGCCCFFFPYGLCAKRKGAKCCSLRPLSAFCSVVQILVTLSKNSVAVALAFSSSFGLYSQLIQQESEGLPVLTLIRSGIMSI